MKYVLGLGVTALIIVAAGGYWLFSDSKLETAQKKAQESAEQLEVANNDDVAATADMNGFGTMNDLVARGEDLECQINSVDDETVINGSYFIADQKIRGDFLVQAPDLEGEVLSSLIIDGDTMYSWTDFMGEMHGITMQLDNTEDGYDEMGSVDLDERVKYNCKPWKNVDQSIFNPPSDVMFQDLSGMMDATMEYGTIYPEEEN